MNNIINNIVFKFLSDSAHRWSLLGDTRLMSLFLCLRSLIHSKQTEVTDLQVNIPAFSEVDGVVQAAQIPTQVKCYVKSCARFLIAN